MPRFSVLLHYCWIKLSSAMQYQHLRQRSGAAHTQAKTRRNLPDVNFIGTSIGLWSSLRWQSSAKVLAQAKILPSVLVLFCKVLAQEAKILPSILVFCKILAQAKGGRVIIDDELLDYLQYLLGTSYQQQQSSRGVQAEAEVLPWMRKSWLLQDGKKTHI